MTTKRPIHASLDIPSEVRSLRESLGLSQVEMAKRCNVSQPTIHAIEHGLYAARIATLLAIANGTDRKLNIGDKNGKLFSRKKKK